MSNQEVFDKVAQLIANRFSVDASTVTEGMTFQQDLGADSLDVVEQVIKKKRGKPEVKTSGFFCASARNVDRMGMLRNKKNQLSFGYRQMSCNVLETR